jgi:hypothetical protein
MGRPRGMASSPLTDEPTRSNRFSLSGRRGYSWSVEPQAVVAVRTQHQARPGRRAIVVTDLASLRGPAKGAVELPLRLFWSSADRRFDLDSASTRRLLYQTVLREAARPSDLTDYLNKAILLRLWPDLRLPAGVRRAWEELHPILASPGSS